MVSDTFLFYMTLLKKVKCILPTSDIQNYEDLPPPTHTAPSLNGQSTLSCGLLTEYLVLNGMVLGR